MHLGLLRWSRRRLKAPVLAIVSGVALVAVAAAPVLATAPDTSITSGPSGPTASRSATFAFTSTISGSTFKCRLDANIWTSCVSPKSYSKLKQGPHTFLVKAKKGTSVDKTPASRSWTVDTVKPTVTLTAKPANPISSTSAMFAFKVSDGTTQCQLDGSAAAACSTSAGYSALGQGSHTFVVRATDAAGNVGSASWTWVVDTQAPTVSITSKPGAVSASNAPSFTFSVSDGTAQCQLDAGAFAPCTSPAGYADLAEGSHTFTAQATDTAGNVGSDSWTWTIDTTPPTATITTKPSLTNDATPTFSFTTNDATSVRCKVDMGGSSNCTSPFTSGSLSDGSHTFTVEATDAAGNTGSDSWTFTVDTQAPVVSFDSVPPANWPVNYFDVSWHASEVASFKCSLNGAAYTTCTSSTTVTTTYGVASSFSVRATDAAGNVSSASTSWTSTPGLVLDYAWEQGSLQNVSLLSQIPAYSPAGTGAASVVGGEAGTALSDPAITFAGTARPLSSNTNGNFYGGMWIRPTSASAAGVLWSTANAAQDDYGMGPTAGHEVFLDGTTVRLRVWDTVSPNAYETSGSVAIGKWSFVSVRALGPSHGLQLFVNGASVGVANATLGTGFEATQGNLKVGPVSNTDVDELRFYNFDPPSPCVTVMHGTLNGQTCLTGPAIELDFEHGALSQTGYMSVVANTPSWSGYVDKTGTGLTLTSGALQLSNFAAQAATPGHSISLWVNTASTAGTLFANTHSCPPANGSCGISVTWTSNHQFTVYASAGGNASTASTTVPSAGLNGGNHSLVVAEQRSSGTTSTIRVYVDGTLSDTLTLGVGDVFANPADTITLANQAGMAIDEVELWPFDLSADQEILCANGFDGTWDAATGSCALTAN